MASSEIVLNTFAGKKAKLFFYTQRELLLFSDGTFAYKRKNKSERIKLSVSPDQIDRLQKSKNVLTITLKDSSTSMSFKFHSEREANEWYVSMKKF
jgi:hypothetical protein|tara:strand:- start:569 stop:856 length:288 start_codon:yes stop_codon:yes gene_type:complete